MRLPPIEPRPDLDALLERARNHKMTTEEIDAQRRSWVRGNIGISYPDMPADQLDGLMRLALGPPFSEQLATARAEARNQALEEAAKLAEGWETEAAGDVYQTCGNGNFWDPGTNYDQGRHDAATAIRALIAPAGEE